MQGASATSRSSRSPASPAVEHKAGIGDRLRRLGRGRHRRLGQAPAAAIVDVEADLDIEGRGDETLRPPHLGERVGFIDRQAPGAGEVAEKQVVLDQIMAEAGLRQFAAGQPQHEIVARIAAPSRGRGRNQPGKQGLRHRPVPLAQPSSRLRVAAGNCTVSPSSSSVMTI